MLYHVDERVSFSYEYLSKMIWLFDFFSKHNGQIIQIFSSPYIYKRGKQQWLLSFYVRQKDMCLQKGGTPAAV